VTQIIPKHSERKHVMCRTKKYLYLIPAERSFVACAFRKSLFLETNI